MAGGAGKPLGQRESEGEKHLEGQSWETLLAHGVCPSHFGVGEVEAQTGTHPARACSVSQRQKEGGRDRTEVALALLGAGRCPLLGGGMAGSLDIQVCKVLPFSPEDTNLFGRDDTEYSYGEGWLPP